MSYPKCVYHKNYDPKHEPEHEKHLNANSRVVHSDADLKILGPDWGDHPSSKKQVLSEEKVAEVLDQVVEAPKKGKKVKE